MINQDNCGNEVYFTVLKFFGLKEIDVNISTIRQLTMNLEKTGLNYYIHIPLQYFINPAWVRYFKKFASKCHITWLQRSVRGVLVHYSTCEQCYDINDTWLHFTCEMYEDGKRISYYDSYENRVKIDYPLASRTKVNHNDLFKLNHIMVFIYKDEK